MSGKLTALKGLDARLKEIRGYLDLVVEGKLPLNHEILYHLQVTCCVALQFLFMKHFIDGLATFRTPSVGNY